MNEQIYTSPFQGYDAGVQGLIQLGRNAIDRVSELERERDETIRKLRDPVAVHVAMLRGEIAVPPLAELLHVYGATFSNLDEANIELAKARETIRQSNKEIDDLIKTDNETIRSLFAYQAKRDETIRQLRAQLDEYERAPTVAWLATQQQRNPSQCVVTTKLDGWDHVELIARPARKGE